MEAELTYKWLYTVVYKEMAAFHSDHYNIIQITVYNLIKPLVPNTFKLTTNHARAH